jgi:hypothetical protein
VFQQLKEIRPMKNMILMVVLLLTASMLSAQAPAAAPPANPMSSEIKTAYTRVANNLLAMAEKMPEENYAFKPVPEIRSFAGTLGHTIDMQARPCATVNGSQAPAAASNMTAKAELVAAMKAAMAECDKAFGSLTDETAVQLLSSGRGPGRSKLGTLYGMVIHDNEEYGYLCIYLRLKGIVPPSSEGSAMGGAMGGARGGAMGGGGQMPPAGR